MPSKGESYRQTYIDLRYEAMQRDYARAMDEAKRRQESAAFKAKYLEGLIGRQQQYLNSLKLHAAKSGGSRGGGGGGRSRKNSLADVQKALEKRQGYVRGISGTELTAMRQYDEENQLPDNLAKVAREMAERVRHQVQNAGADYAQALRQDFDNTKFRTGAVSSASDAHRIAFANAMAEILEPSLEAMGIEGQEQVGRQEMAAALNIPSETVSPTFYRIQQTTKREEYATRFTGSQESNLELWESIALPGMDLPRARRGTGQPAAAGAQTQMPVSTEMIGGPPTDPLVREVQPATGTDTSGMERVGPGPEAVMPTSAPLASPAFAHRGQRMTPAQYREADRILNRFRDAGFPDSIARAAIVNSFHESGLDPGAVNDTGSEGTRADGVMAQSVGLFQLNDAGGAMGAGMSVEDRSNPEINIGKMIDAAKGPGGGRLRQAAAMGASVPELTQIFTEDLEQPEFASERGAERAATASEWFSDVSPDPFGESDVSPEAERAYEFGEPTSTEPWGVVPEVVPPATPPTAGDEAVPFKQSAADITVEGATAPPPTARGGGGGGGGSGSIGGGVPVKAIEDASAKLEELMAQRTALDEALEASTEDDLWRRANRIGLGPMITKRSKFNPRRNEEKYFQQMARDATAYLRDNDPTADSSDAGMLATQIRDLIAQGSLSRKDILSKVTEMVGKKKRRRDEVVLRVMAQDIQSRQNKVYDDTESDERLLEANRGVLDTVKEQLDTDIDLQRGRVIDSGADAVREQAGGE